MGARDDDARDDDAWDDYVEWSGLDEARLAERSARRAGRPPVDAWDDYVEWSGLDEARLRELWRTDE